MCMQSVKFKMEQIIEDEKYSFFNNNKNHKEV
jgi:hypothetical protein